MKKNKSPILYPAIEEPQPIAECLFCLDPRFANAFPDFIERELGLKKGNYVPLSVAGGPAALAHPEDMRNRCRYIVRQTMFSCEHFPTIKRFILIGHEDCGYYQVIPTNGNTCNRERADLPIAANFLGLLVPEKAVIEAYYAYFADKSRKRIAFEQVV